MAPVPMISKKSIHFDQIELKNQKKEPESIEIKKNL